MPKKTKIIVSCNEKEGETFLKARNFAKSHSFSLSPAPAGQNDITLSFRPEKISLLARPGREQPLSEVFIDFVKGKAGYRNRHETSIKQPLARAVGIKGGLRPSIIDATAGFGYDSFVLASLGCEVIMVERSPVISLLLTDALRRASCEKKLAQTVARMTPVNADSINYLKSSKKHVDTIYLDPMYPHAEKSALKKKEMRILRQLVGPDRDGKELFLTAMACAKKRVVVKRPLKAPAIVDNRKRAADFTVRMKKHRFDVYLA